MTTKRSGTPQRRERNDRIGRRHCNRKQQRRSQRKMANRTRQAQRRRSK